VSEQGSVDISELRLHALEVEVSEAANEVGIPGKSPDRHGSRRPLRIDFW
jgi:hypothetical protein